MDTPLDRVILLLRREMLVLERGSEPYSLVRDAIADLCVGNARPPTIRLLAEKSRHWFERAMNAPSDVLRDFEAGLEPSDHSLLFEQTADDFEDVLKELQGGRQFQEVSVG